MDKKEIKKACNELRPQYNIGKNGITDTFVKSVNEYLDAHKIVKIKCSSAGIKDEVAYFAEEISSKTQSEIVDKRGFTFTIFRVKKL